MKMELTEGSETSAYINQTPGNHPKGNLLKYYFLEISLRQINIYNSNLNKFTLINVNQSHYRPEAPRGFQEVKVPRFYDNSTGWW
jgi:hypothetical protein